VAASTTTWWVVGYAIGAAVVLIAATLLLTIILLARRIARQARDIAWALEEATRHTEALFELAQMNHAVEQLSRALAADGGAEDERGPIRRVVDKLTAGKL
jgi:hypothetical protein